MTETSPHTIFRRFLEILDELRRDSIKALKDTDKSQMLGLTVRQGSAISQLRLMLEEMPQGVSLKSLANRLQMTVPATSLLVEALVSKGYTQRTPNPDDRRARNLTPEELSIMAGIVEKMQG